MLDVRTLPDLSVDIGLGAVESTGDGSVVVPAIIAIVASDPMIPVMVFAAIVMYTSNQVGGG